MVLEHTLPAVRTEILYTMEEIWSNRTCVDLALFSLLSTCVVF
jgi:hypothetical protein